jgi:hypothetical protein
MADQRQIAHFVRTRVTIGQVQPGGHHLHSFYDPYAVHFPYGAAPLPTAAQAGEDFYRDAEFRALQLGTFLNTPSGEFLEQAVELVVPRLMSPEFELIVGALKYAAARQQGETRSKAALAVGGSLLLGLFLSELGKAA